MLNFERKERKGNQIFHLGLGHCLHFFQVPDTRKALSTPVKLSDQEKINKFQTTRSMSENKLARNTSTTKFAACGNH